MSKNKKYTCIACDRSKCCRNPNEICNQCNLEETESREANHAAIKERVREANKPTHSCPWWDFMQLHQGDDEMDGCQCDFSIEGLWNRIGELEKQVKELQDGLEWSK